MRRFNFNAAELQHDGDEPAGYDAAYALIGEAIGGKHLGGMLVELEPGQHSAPYHWEAAIEEWVIVLEGRPSLRDPDGERELRAGDVVCFGLGPSGAHRLTNRTSQTARIIMLSDRRPANVIVYPDSGKVGVRTPDLRANYQQEADVGYSDREP